MMCALSGAVTIHAPPLRDTSLCADSPRVASSQILARGCQRGEHPLHAHPPLRTRCPMPSNGQGTVGAYCKARMARSPAIRAPTGLRALALEHARAVLLPLGLGHVELVEGAQTAQDRPTQPRSVLALLRRRRQRLVPQVVLRGGSHVLRPSVLLAPRSHRHGLGIPLACDGPLLCRGARGSQEVWRRRPPARCRRTSPAQRAQAGNEAASITP